MIKINIEIENIDELEIISKIGLFHLSDGEQQLIALEEIDISIVNDNDLIYLRNTNRAIPNYGNGVYILYKNGEIIKVGQSNDVGNRLLIHDCKKQNKRCLTTNDWDSFSVITCEDDYTSYITEVVYTLLYNPKKSKLESKKYRV